MNFISWREDYSVKNEVIDNQHKKLFALINDLYEAFVTKSDNLGVERIINELSDYTENHFKEEEKLFAFYNYAEAEEHIKEHKIFINTIQEITEKYKENPKSFSTRITSFLQKWLINHILETDKKYISMFPE
ncbi:MAG: hemerythrin family protein [Bacteroidales bacterium]|nr:hemerythrin family protein [Bacteroidales bacterium]MBN2819355.1 hemerythrin family protein [Bacteroidales bacterium]